MLFIVNMVGFSYFIISACKMELIINPSPLCTISPIRKSVI